MRYSKADFKMLKGQTVKLQVVVQAKAVAVVVLLTTKSHANATISSKMIFITMNVIMDQKQLKMSILGKMLIL